MEVPALECPCAAYRAAGVPGGNRQPRRSRDACAAQTIRVLSAMVFPSPFRPTDKVRCIVHDDGELVKGV